MRKLINSLRALSDEIRLRIINLLSTGELCVCEIVDTLQLPQSTVSRHLTILKNAGMVEDNKQGQWVFYKLTSGKDDNSFIERLVDDEFNKLTVFKKDIQILQKRMEKGRGCNK